MQGVFLVSLALVLGAQSVAAQEGSLPPLEEQVIEESTSLKALGLVQNYMATTKSLKGSFRQTAPNNNISNGTLYMARPGKIRFDFEGDIPFLVVADGKTLNFIDYEIGQVSRWPVKDTPLRALLGDTFDAASINAHIEVAPHGIERILALTANDPANPEAGQITVYFEQLQDVPDTLKMLSWVVLDAQGETTTVEIMDQQTNIELASSLWTFEDPRGSAKRRRTRR